MPSQHRFRRIAEDGRTRPAIFRTPGASITTSGASCAASSSAALGAKPRRGLGRGRLGRNHLFKLDAHRKRQQALHPELTVTGMYNALEKLRSGEALTEKEKIIHEQGLVSVLKQIHDDLDAAVFDAYGWPHDLTDEQILERLVALNAEHAEEERRGIVRWLRPEFQNPGGAGAAQQTAMAGVAIEATEAEVKPKAAMPWPKELPLQIAAVRDLIASGTSTETWTIDRAARTFKGAKRLQLLAALDSLAALGLIVTFGEGNERQWRAPINLSS